MDEDVKSAPSKPNPEPRDVASDRRGEVQVFSARPIKGVIDYKQMRDRIHERFSKTIAYLAK